MGRGAKHTFVPPPYQKAYASQASPSPAPTPMKSTVSEVDSMVNRKTGSYDVEHFSPGVTKRGIKTVFRINPERSYYSHSIQHISVQDTEVQLYIHSVLYKSPYFVV